MIDGGSTTIHFARQLAAQSRQVTVLTNSLGVAAALGQDPSSKVVLCPGDYQPYEGIVTGPETIAATISPTRASSPGPRPSPFSSASSWTRPSSAPAA
jgi:DeoR/GlpR family transcriptional regulator of sugar metabolism